MTGSSRLVDWRFLGPVLAAWLVFRIVYYVGIGNNDDLFYIAHAESLYEGINILANGGSQLAWRLGMIAPLVVIRGLIGPSELGFSLFPLFFSLLTCIFLYLAAARLWGSTAGLIAAGLWAIYPLQLVYDSQLSPSVQHATCLAGSLACFYLPLKSQGMKPGRAKLLYFISGAWLGLGWTFNELFVVMALGGLVVLLFERPGFSALVWLAVGFFCFFALDFIIAGLVSGGFTDRIVSIAQTEGSIGTNRDLGYYPRVRFKVVAPEPFDHEGHFGIMWYLFALVPFVAWFRKNKTALALSIAGWVVMAYLQWGVISPEGQPIGKYIRYLSMIVPFQCLSLAGIVSARDWNRRRAAWLLIGGLILGLHLVYTGAQAVSAARSDTRDFRGITSFLIPRAGDESVYLDGHSKMYVRLFSRHRLNLHSVDDRYSAPQPKGGYVVADGWRRIIEDEPYRASLPKWFLDPPRQWELIHVVTGPETMSIFDRYDPKIYFIGPSPPGDDSSAGSAGKAGAAPGSGRIIDAAAIAVVLVLIFSAVLITCRLTRGSRQPDPGGEG